MDDPRLRDEDLSNTIVSSSYRILPDGMYEYLYDIESPLENKGVISSFDLDISCDKKFDPVIFSERPEESFESYSEDGKHVPVLAEGVMYYTAMFGISVRNRLFWTFVINPGETAKGFRVVSPIPPGKISYTLIPIMHVDGWDYSSYPEDDPTVPWIADFTVTGSVIGPACPDGSGSFNGTNKYENEAQEINNLLTYSSPTSDRFHVSDDVNEIEMTIHYGAQIDPKTFKVEPANLKKYFNPEPGTSQRLVLPLKNNKNKTKLKFSVRAVTSKKEKENNSTKSEDTFTAKEYIDYDEFEIRMTSKKSDKK